MERRFWYGLGVLLALMILGLWTGWIMEQRQDPITTDLERAAQAAMSGDTDRGAALVEKAEAAWKQTKILTATAADHGPMEEIESLFAQIRVYARAGEWVDFSAYCTRLAQLVAAVGETHKLSWQNLL